MDRFSHSIGFKQDGPSLRFVILLGLIHGLLFVFLVPPWQHYDEPTHFEYAWLISSRLKLPDEGDHNQYMRREVAASMIEHRFFNDLSFKPDLLSSDEPIWIGLSQFADPPLYYLIAAIPLGLIRSADIDLQLYVLRLFSLGLYLLTIVISWGILRELDLPNRSLHWMVPLTLALLPGFTDLMTSVNNDVGAVTFFSLFLWSIVRLIKRGASWSKFAMAGLFTLLCVWTKETVIIAIPLFLLAILILMKARFQWKISIPATVLVMLASIPFVFNFEDLASWHRINLPTHPVRIQMDAVQGDYVLAVTLENGEQARLVQELPARTIEEIRGKTVILGGWIWGNKATRIRSPGILDSDRATFQNLDIETEPTLIAVPIEVSDHSTSVRVILDPLLQPISGLTVYYDGLFLMVDSPGPRSSNFPDGIGDLEIAKLGDESANLLRNGSGEHAQVRLRPWVESGLVRVFGPKIQTSLVISSIFDLDTSGWYFQATAQNLFRTFWAKFGWGDVPLLGLKPYRFLLYFTVVVLLGSALAIRRLRNRSAVLVVILGTALVGSWLQAMLIGIRSIAGKLFIPAARFAFPAIIPTALILNLGFVELFDILSRRLPIGRQYLVWIYLGSFLSFDIYALLSLLANFYWRV